jgi:FkbM family methyltransferase
MLLMKELIRTILRSARVLRRIRALDLREDLKSKIRATYLRTILLKRYDSQNNIADMVGYKVKFCTYASFAFLFDEIFVNQEYFFLTSSKNPFIVDCGSNIGMSILYFKMMYPDCEILAFEPDTAAFVCLEENVTLNGLGSVAAHKKALSRSDGQTDFYYDQDIRGCLSMSTVRARMPRQRQVVEAVRLSSYINREVDFLKMDVEGAERAILEELGSEGKLSYIKQMVIEFHHHIVADADELSQMLRILEDAGFGYQVQSDLERPFRRQQFQDILIYAYRKDCAA